MRNSIFITRSKRHVEACWLSAATLLLIILIVSCSSKVIPTDHLGEREVQIIAASLDDSPIVSGAFQRAGSVSLALRVDTSITYEDAQHGGHYKAIDKIELCYDDSGTWFDVTAEWLDQWDYELPYDVETFHHHSYTDPGEYTIRARVTFWDGELVYSKPGVQEVQVRVLTPES